MTMPWERDWGSPAGQAAASSAPPWERDWGQPSAKPEEPRGTLAEVGSQLAAGAVVDLPRMVGKAMQWMSEPGTDFHETGKRWSEAADVREEENPWLKPQPEGRGIVGRALSMGARAIPPSVAGALPAVAAAPLGATAAIATGAASVAGLFGSSQAQETYENVLRAGESEEDAKAAGYINGLIEAGGETIGTIAGLKLFGIGAKAFGKALSPTQAAILGRTETAVWAPFAKQLPKTAAIQAGTEFGQNAAEAEVETRYGVEGREPLKEGLEGGLAALGMTALLAPFGLGGFAMRAKSNERVADALTDPESDPANRIAAAKLVHDEIAKVNQEAAQAWSRNSAIAIAGKAPIVLDESFAKPQDPVERIMTAPTVDQAIAEATQAAAESPPVEPTSTPTTTAPAFDEGLTRAPTWDTLQPGQSITLYRGESAQNEAGGQWWTSDRAKAERFGKVSEVTLPADLVAQNAARGHGGSDEFVFPNKRPPELAAGGAIQGEQVNGRPGDEAVAPLDIAVASLDELRAAARLHPDKAQRTAARAEIKRRVAVGKAQAPSAQAAPEAQQPAATAAPALLEPAAGEPATTIDQAAHEAAPSPQNNLPAPTEAQIDAGNYQKGHARVSGMDVSIENPAGSKRRPEWPTLKDHYGYIKGVPARAPDKEHIDVFLKPGTPEDFAGDVYVVDQKNKAGKFDEPKVVIGAASLEEARALYLRNYSPGWDGVMGITPMPMATFKEKLQDAEAFRKPQSGGRAEAGVPPLKRQVTIEQTEAPQSATRPLRVTENADLGEFSVREDKEGGASMGTFKIADGKIVALKARAQWAEDDVRAAAEKFAAERARNGAAPAALPPSPMRDAVEAVAEPFGAKNKVFTADAAAKAREILRKKLGQVNAGLDPEVIQAGLQLAGYYIEAGARSFSDYSAKMIADLGEAVKPYLKSWYLAVRNYPGFDNRGMQSEAQLDEAENTRPVGEGQGALPPWAPEPTGWRAKWSAKEVEPGTWRMAGRSNGNPFSPAFRSEADAIAWANEEWRAQEERRAAEKAELEAAEKGKEQTATAVLGKPMDKLTKRELEVTAKKARSEEQRAAAKAEIDRRHEKTPKEAPQRKPGSAFLQAIRRAGGLDSGLAMEIGGDSALVMNRRLPGLFRKGGMSEDRLREWVLDHGYLTQQAHDEADRNATGGAIEVAKEFVRRAVRGEDVVTAMEGEDALRHRYDEEARRAKDLQEDMEAVGVSAEEQEVAIQALSDHNAPDNWNTLSAEEQDAHLDQIFGPRKAIAQGEVRPQEAPQAEVRPAEAAEREPGQDDEEVAAGSVERPTLSLTGQTESEIRTDEAMLARDAEERRRRDQAPPPSSFSLTGSDRPADEAVARGQNELFGERGTSNAPRTDEVLRRNVNVRNTRRLADVTTPSGALKAEARNSDADSSPWYHQGDLGQLRFDVTAKVNGRIGGSEHSRKTLAELDAARTAGWQTVNMRAGSLGTVWTLQKDGEILTKAGAEALRNGTFKATEVVETGDRDKDLFLKSRAVASDFAKWLATLPASTLESISALQTKIGQTPMGERLELFRGAGGEPRIRFKELDGFNLGAPQENVGSSMRSRTDFQSLLVAIVNYSKLPETIEHWADASRQADAVAIEQVTEGGTVVDALRKNGYLPEQTQNAESPSNPVAKAAEALAQAANALKAAAEGKLAETPAKQPAEKSVDEQAVDNMTKGRRSPIIEEHQTYLGERLTLQHNPEKDQWGVITFTNEGTTVGRWFKAEDEQKAREFYAKLVEQDKENATAALERERRATMDPERTYTLNEHGKVFERAMNGRLKADEFKAAFERALKSQPALLAEFSKFTKQQLVKRRRSFGSFAGDPKERLVRMAYSDLLQDFVLSDSFSYVMGTKVEDAIRAQVEKTTDADLVAYAERVKKSRAEREERHQQIMASIEDPQTMEDFERFLRIKKQSDLTPEQLRRFDDLMAARGRERRARIEENRSRVEAAGEAVGAKIIETKHTKKGHDLFVVQLEKRVERDDYNRLNAAAKRLGGYYSSFRGAGAVPGFQFTSRENAEVFQKLAGGDAQAATETVQELRATNRAAKKNAAAERLAEMADRMEEAAQERLSADRLTNTARRARMAESAEAQARADERMAKTLRAISDAIEEGKATNLDGIRTRKQVEELESILRLAKYESIRLAGLNFEEERHRAPTEADVVHAKYPRYSGVRSDFAALARRVIEIPGAKMAGERLLKATDDSKDYAKAVSEDPLLLNKVLLGKRAEGATESTAALFKTKGEAEAAVRRSGARREAMVVPLTGRIGKGHYAVVLGPAEAKGRGLWQPKEDPKLNIEPGLMEEILEKVAAYNVGKPWPLQITPGYYFDGVRESRKRLQAMGIENTPELRAALREYVGLRFSERQRDRVKELERALSGRADVGLDFFPTPAPLAARMAEALQLQPGMTVLEPSAGKGNLADAVREAEPGAQIDVVEQSVTLREILEAKGYSLVGTDFMAFRPEELYDRVIMNPPFSNGLDADHVQRAYEILKPGGKLVAITGEGIFFREDAKARAFREWFDQVGGTSEEMDGAFTDRREVRTTGARSRLLTITKPDDDGGGVFSRSPRDGGISPRDAQAVASRVRLALRGAPPIHIVEDIRKAPKDLLAQIREANGEGDVEAAFHEGDIYVFPQNIASVERAEFVIAHHEIRHFGLRGMLGPKFSSVMLSIYQSNPRIKEAADAMVKSGRVDAVVDGTEEALADLPVAEVSVLKGFARLVAAIREALRKVAARLRTLGLRAAADAIEPSKWTDSDVARLVGRAEALARDGDTPFAAGGTTFATESDNRGNDGGKYGSRSFWRLIIESGARSAGLLGQSGVENVLAAEDRRTNARGVARMDEGEGEVSPQTARARWSGKIAGYRGHFTLATVTESSGRKRFTYYVIPEELAPGGPDRAKLDDLSIIRFVFTEKPDGTFEFSVNDPDAGSTAYESLKERGRLEMTSRFTADGAHEYMRVTLDDRVKDMRSLMTEAVRRLALQIGEVPHIVYSGRETGAAAGKSGGITPEQVVARFSQGEDFKRWFGDSKVVDENGKPLVMYHGTTASFDEFRPDTGWFTALPDEAEIYGGMGVSGSNVRPAYLSIKNPRYVDAATATKGSIWDALSLLTKDQDGVIVRENGKVRWAIVANPSQIKSAIGNRGTFSRAMEERVRSEIGNLFTSQRTFNRWWHKTVGTQFHKAKIDRHFRRVFNIGQEYLTDTSRYAMQAEQEAPDLLLRLEDARDVFKRGLSKADKQALAGPIFEGTLENKLWTDEELREKGLNDKQIGYYRQFRQSVDHSLEELAKSTMAKMAHAIGIEMAAVKALRDMPFAGFHSELSELMKARAKLLNEAAEQMADGDQAKPLAIERAKQAKAQVTATSKLYNRVEQLKSEGYAPLMRFGEYTVYVTEEGEKGPEGVFFGMYETEREANAAAKQLAQEFPNAEVIQGVVSTEGWRVFQGVSPDTIEIFAKAAGLDQEPAFQEYLRLAVNNRSSMKRLIHRKGIPGFSQDVTRVLASFVTSNARLTASNYHLGELAAAVDAIPKEKGDVKDEAERLRQYLTDPKEEAGTLRGLLFFQYLGGSIAAALVNATQPLTMTAPYLAKYADAKTVGKEIGRASMEAAKNAPGPDVRQAYQRAVDDGIVAPHEIYQLMAQARGNVMGATGLARVMKVWGAFFSLTEAFNRRTTFLAAYRIAVKKGIKNPYSFAREAVYETQGLYNKGNRPNWARGAVGATIFTFKQFSIAYVEFLKRLHGTNPKAFWIAMGVLLMAAGVEGLPFAEDLEDIIDTIGQWLGYATNSKKWLRYRASQALGDGAAQFVLHGFSAIPGFPLDVSMRLGLQNLIPGTSLLKPSDASDKGREIAEVLGPAGGLVKSGFDVGRALFQGDFDEMAKSGLPVALKNAYHAMEMLSTGEYRDTRGRKVIETDTADAVIKAIGFQPTTVAKESRKVSEVMSDIRLQRATESAIADQWARGIADRKPDEISAAVKKLRQWNTDNPELRIRINMSQVRRRVQEMRRSREERVTRSAAPEIRAGVREALRQ